MRVIAGAAKGRRLAGPDGDATRPMTDRAREGLFSAIAGDLVGADVVDLYAGTGSMGLEALSRGADTVVFVERDRNALRALEANIDSVGLGGRIERTDVLGYLRSTNRRVDLAFVDPPYDLSLPSVIEVMEALVPLLEPDALVVLHRRVGEERPEIRGLADAGERAYGTAQLWRYRATDNEEPT